MFKAMLILAKAIVLGSRNGLQLRREESMMDIHPSRFITVGQQ